MSVPMTRFFLTMGLVCYTAATFGESQPKVGALIIGVREYKQEENRIPEKEPTSPSRMSAAVRKAYPGALVTELFDTNATLDMVNAAVNRLVEMPEDSLLIIYFGGHGVTGNLAGGRNELRLLLWDAQQFSAKQQADGTYLSFAPHILNRVLGRQKRFNLLILLDCCHAGLGQRDLVLGRAASTQLYLRTVILSASQKLQTAQAGHFVTALEQGWASLDQTNANAEPNCSPTEFARVVKKTVRELSQDTNDPWLASGADIQSCFMQLGSPRCLLGIHFDAESTGGEFDVYVNGRRVEESPLYQEAMKDGIQIIVSVPKKQTVVKVQLRGANQPYYTTNIPASELAGDWKLVPVPLPLGMAVHGAASAEHDVKVMQFFTEAIEGYGANPGPLYVSLEAARLRLELVRNEKTKNISQPTEFVAATPGVGVLGGAVGSIYGNGSRWVSLNQSDGTRSIRTDLTKGKWVVTGLAAPADDPGILDAWTKVDGAIADKTYLRAANMAQSEALERIGNLHTTSKKRSRELARQRIFIFSSTAAEMYKKSGDSEKGKDWEDLSKALKDSPNIPDSSIGYLKILADDPSLGTITSDEKSSAKKMLMENLIEYNPNQKNSLGP